MQTASRPLHVYSGLTFVAQSNTADCLKVLPHATQNELGTWLSEDPAANQHDLQVWHTPAALGEGWVISNPTPSGANSPVL